MRKLVLEDRAEWERLKLALEAAEAALVSAADAAGTLATEGEARAAVAAEWPAYVAAIGNVQTFAERIHEEAEAYFDERSEKWQESERGEEYGAFVESWERVKDMEVPEEGDPAPVEEVAEGYAFVLAEKMEDGDILAAMMGPGED